ncbi:hypothetical protein NH341_06160 [Tenacibaculum sp. XPcli2-G]|uniref:hypothetical protein n=1 Tax=Tenacibaculum sp. XPcli2-G TaxID=2954503 RepID=UPI002096B19F|nr:hypothetical protein [Tenacibaculum sp. XPcli2-G]MCO7185001.1 hypothetical protein [Tenacibaculum sp. XPcli2-G]
MRNIVRNYNDKPRVLTLSSTLSEWNNVALRTQSNIKRALYSDPYYDINGNTASRVIDHLNKWYLYKCAYCERVYKLDVEHYRPKGEVRDLNNKLVNITNSKGTIIPHPGYYWLCYEWSNLLPACISCNRDGGKVSKFPTIHSYVKTPPLNSNYLDIPRCLISDNGLTIEQPFLLNPELDVIDDVFEFEVDSEKKGISMKGKDQLGRGQATIDICQMNRPEIRVDRLRSVVYPIRKVLLALLKQLSTGNKDIQQIKNEVNSLIQKLYDDANDPELDFTYLRSYIIHNSKNFDDIVIPFMPIRIKEVLITAFQNYKPI